MTSSELNDLVRTYFPGASDREVRSVLWSCTGYPGFSHTAPDKTPLDCLKDQLGEVAPQSGGSVQRALEIAMEELDEAMAQQVTPDPQH